MQPGVVSRPIQERRPDYYRRQEAGKAFKIYLTDTSVTYKTGQKVLDFSMSIRLNF